MRPTDIIVTTEAIGRRRGKCVAIIMSQSAMDTARRMAVEIRTFQPGDEEAQADIYNEAAANLSKFKPASAEEVSRRTAAKDFDPSMRFYAIEGGAHVAYAVFNANGRVSYPWCRSGHEQLAVPLFDHMIQAMRQRGFTKAFAAYRGDWPPVLDFFRERGFVVAR